MLEESAARRRAVFAVLGPVLALMLVGCGGGDESERDAPRTGKSQSPPSRTASTASAPTATPTPIPQEAQDGRDFDACLDRSCEVEVREGDTIRFAPKYVTDTFTVDGITDSRVEFSATDDQPSPLRGWVGGTGEIETGDIHVDFDRTDGGRIILKFSPR